MKLLTDPRTWLALASLALVLWLVARDVEKVAPGPLHPSHAALDELAGVRNCVECHGEGDEDLATGCLACHAPIAQQLELGRGLHGDLPGDRQRLCEECHVEHLGADLPLVGTRAFERAGFANVADYDHAGLAFSLAGRHAELACEQCHPRADAPALVAGEQRFLGLSQACESCHADPHEGAMSPDCASCHGQARPFVEVASFEHEPAFPLTGAHAGRACVDCHADDSTRSIAASLAGTGRGTRTCVECHDTSHAPAVLASWARLADYIGCTSCHAAEAGGFKRAVLTPAAHAGAGFELIAAHASVPCAECHGAPSDPWAERFPGRAADDCRACHADPHAGQFRERSCAECHGPDAFAPTTFGRAAHAATDFPLTGVHADVGCAACHAPGPEARFAETPAACVDCHEDVHRGTFDAGATLADGRTDCAACHSTKGFRALFADAFDHGRDTGFALEEAHADAACEACHLPHDGARRLGFLADRLGDDARRCATCHDDPHARFIADTGDCGRCHGTRDFAEVPAFEHGLETGFALSGAHADRDCATCHGSGDGRRLGHAATHFPGPRDRCATCHVDPHDGLFAAAGDCGTCHGDASFAQLVADPFDHARWTGYALASAHAEAACAACHAPLPAPDFLGRRSARARGKTCADCHADPHLGQFARAGATDCARCHGESSFTELRFDHGRDARFALDATHAKLACAACHKPHELAGGARAVRYRPLGTRCVDCHGQPGGGR